MRLEGGAVVYHSTNHRIRTRTKTQRGWLAYVTFGPRAKGTVNGLPIHPELVLAVEPETEVRIRHRRRVREHHAPASRRWTSARTCASGAGRATSALPQGVETLQADAAMVRRLFDWGKRLVDTAARQPALFNDRKEQRAAAQVEMIETLLATLGSTTDFEPTRADQTHQSQSAHREGRRETTPCRTRTIAST